MADRSSRAGRRIVSVCEFEGKAGTLRVHPAEFRVDLVQAAWGPVSLWELAVSLWKLEENSCAERLEESC
jgi:hypothetical protein